MPDADPIYGPAGEEDAVTAYLFRCPANGRLAVSTDQAGANLPQEVCSEGWQFEGAFALGVHEALPIPADPEPVLRGLRHQGYFI